MSCFTKGPWRVDHNHRHYVVCDHATMVVCVCGSSLTQETREANARLIAAAPDMFEVAASFPGLAASPAELNAWNKLRLAALAKASPSASSGRNLADAHKNPLPGEIAP